MSSVLSSKREKPLTKLALAEVVSLLQHTSRPRFLLFLRQAVRLRLSEEEQALLDLSEGLALSDVNPLHEEVRRHISLARTVPADSRSTIGFWKENSAELPTLSKVARRVLAVSGTSCDVERLFSRAGLICTALRSRLAPKTIQCLSSLHYYYAAEEKAQQSTRSASADGRAKRFAVLTTALLIEAGDKDTSDSESEDELDF